MAEKQKRSQHKKTKPVDPSILKSHNLCKSIQKIKKEKIFQSMFEDLIHKTNIIYLDAEKLYGIVFIEHLNKLRAKAQDRKMKIHELELTIHQKDLEIATLKTMIKNQILQRLRLQQRQKYLRQVQLKKLRKKNQDSQIFQREYDKGRLKSKQRKQNINQFSSENQNKMDSIEIQVQTQFFQFNKKTKYYNFRNSQLQSIHIKPTKECIKKCFGQYQILQKRASQTMNFFSTSLHSRLNQIQNIQQEAVNCLKQNKILKDINIKLLKQVKQLKDERQKRQNSIWQNELNVLVGQIKNEWKIIQQNQNLVQQKKVQRSILPQENPVQVRQATAEQKLKKFEKFKVQFLSKGIRRG